MKKQFTLITSLMLFTIFSTGLIAQQYKTLSDFPEHIRKTNPFKRFEWGYQQRAFPYDTIPLIYANRVAKREIDKIIDKRNQLEKDTSYVWSSMGPSFVDFTNHRPCWDTVSGRVRTLAVHPTDPLTVYIGAASGGLWKTTDGGETWMDIGHDLPALTFGAIAIDPNSPETVYAGSGEPLSAISTYKYQGYGMYKSTDGGSNWETIDAFGEYTAFTDIVVSPENSNIVYASLSSGPYNLGYFLPCEGLWKSTDAGNTWVKTLDEYFTFDITLHPINPNIIYASVGGWSLHSGSGIYMSTDQGETWNYTSTGLPDQNIIDRIQLDISQSDPNILYAVVAIWHDTIPNGELTRAYKSTNGGMNWFRISEDVPLGGFNGSYWYDQGWYDLCIAVDPLNSDHVFIGNVELHETTDGENFSVVRYPGGYSLIHSIAHCDYHQLKYAPSDPNYFYMGTDGGVYLSTDDCNSATQKNIGLETLQFYRMGSHPTDPDIMIGGLQDNGTIRTLDGGNSWEVVITGDGMECFFDYQNPDIVYGSRQLGQLMKSFDGGANFYRMKIMNGNWVTPFIIHPTGHDTLYAANNNMYRYPRTQGSYAWEQMTNNLSEITLNSLNQSSVNPDNMILSGFDFPNSSESLVMISIDGGYNWENVTDVVPGETRWISRVLCDPVDDSTMYIVRCGYSENNKIWKTTDLGETWSNVSGDLPDIPCNTMWVNPYHPNEYFVGTDLGVYISYDWGETYHYGGGDMPLIPIMDFDFVHIDGKGYLRMATYGRGIYETILLYTDIEEYYSNQEIAIQSYPNPFSAAMHIEYLLPEASNTRLSIYNQLGKELKVLVNETQPAGNHKASFDGSHLQAGVYFCVLKSGSGTQTRKIIKL